MTPRMAPRGLAGRRTRTDRRPSRRSSHAIALGALVCGCSGHGARLVWGYPWLEDPSVELAAERLVIRVNDSDVAVEARFELIATGVRNSRTLTFPIPPGCGPARGFSATLERPHQRPYALAAVQSSASSPLLMGDVLEAYDIGMGAPALAAGERGAVLVVRYAQRCTNEFRYTLLSGAYWSGPIGRLEVSLLDPRGRVAAASVEGRPARRPSPGHRSWRFEAVEPRAPIIVELKPSPASADWP